MKKQLLLLSLVCIAISANGQISIPNGNFEKWSSSSYELPDNYYYSSNINANNDGFNVTKTSDAFHGQSAVKLVTSLNGLGYFLNCNPNNGEITSWRGGMAYNQKPSGVRGYYKYNVSTGDMGVIIAKFTKAGVDIGTYYCKVGEVKTDYTLFNINFNPALTEIPDSVIFGAVSSDFTANDNGVMGSTLYLDSVSFTGVTIQPENLNGDFEKWNQSQTSYKLEDWPNKDNQSVGVSRTTDVPVGGGQYALELTTTLSTNKQGVNKAQNGFISTGYYDQKCNCLIGGQPYSHQIDTLAFWYKYIPTSTTKAQISLLFKKGGNFQQWVTSELTWSSNYKYLEIPFNLGQVPDSVIVQIISSTWQDTLIAFVGSDLKIDNLYFKSQKTNTGLIIIEDNSQIQIYPNPSNGQILIKGLRIDVTKLEIYNFTGVTVYTTTKFDSNNTKQIDISNTPPGIYFVKVSDNKGIYTKKILIK